MNFDEFFDSVSRKNLTLDFDNQKDFKGVQLSNEALFHLPLIALIILYLSKGRRKPRLDEIGQIVGECLEKSLVGFKGSSQHIGWSANLRIRTVKALSFLEMSKLVEINSTKKIISATPLGQKIIQTVFKEESNLSYLLMLIDQSYRNICVEKQMEIKFS